VAWPRPQLIAVLRGIEPSEAVAIAGALFSEGVGCVEVTLNSPQPFDSIAAIRNRFGDQLLLGAGTVLTPSAVREAAAAGAQLIISPNTDPAVIAETKAAGLPSLPGVFTPTDCFTALKAGADALKLFPAEAASPAVLKALLTVLPEGTPVLPVGGVQHDSLASWRAVGAAGFCVGAALYRPGRTPDEVRRRARQFVESWRDPA
jgi:2-dehydro-3-deoxyphosphogalactonate aldolase